MKRTPLACLFTLVPVLAWAGIVPGSTHIAGTGPFVWTYDFRVVPDRNVDGDRPLAASPAAHNRPTLDWFITLYDFAGYIAGSCTGPAGWECTAQYAGFTPGGMLADDNAGLLDLTWVYTAGPAGRPWGGHQHGRDLGPFSAASIHGTSTTLTYAAQGARRAGVSTGTTEGPRVNVVPEPGSLPLAGLAMLLIGGLPAKRRAAVSV